MGVVLPAASGSGYEQLSFGTHMMQHSTSSTVLLHVHGLEKDPPQWTLEYEDVPHSINDTNWRCVRACARA